MSIIDKLNQLKNTIQEIKNIESRLEDTRVYKTKINELNEEIIKLKKGIKESVKELEDFLKNKNA